MPRTWWGSSLGSTASGWRWSTFDYDVVELRPGFLSFRVTGKRAQQAFAHEGGGHRWQRVPPTEKRGRVHTSTVTVAVMDEPREHEIFIDPADVEETFVRGSGSGGQKRNKTDSAVMLKHRPSGIRIRAEGERSQYFNRLVAMNVLRAKLKAHQDGRLQQDREDKRRQQVGSGMRGDKRRTIAVQRDSVVDHVTGREISFRHFSRGKLGGLLAGA